MKVRNLSYPFLRSLQRRLIFSGRARFDRPSAILDLNSGEAWGEGEKSVPRSGSEPLLCPPFLVLMQLGCSNPPPVGEGPLN